MNSWSARPIEEVKGNGGRRNSTSKGTEFCLSFRGPSGWVAEGHASHAVGIGLLQRAVLTLQGLQLKSDLLQFVVLHHYGGRRVAGLGVGGGWRQESPTEAGL